ncbi:hypothetical protein ACP70R_043318 [Stipagrostis hirtigluma subsp. patula]
MAFPSMARSRFFPAVLFCLALLAVTAGGARPPPTSLPAPPVVPSAAAWAAGLAERLDAGGLPQQCWAALVEIKSCTGEIILFFVNGEVYLGPACCRAIRVVEHSCWAADAVLSAIGFTPEEGDMLKGYCDVDGSPLPAPPLRGVVGDGAAAARESVAVVAGRKGSVHR